MFRCLLNYLMFRLRLEGLRRSRMQSMSIVWTSRRPRQKPSKPSVGLQISSGLEIDGEMPIFAVWKPPAEKCIISGLSSGVRHINIAAAVDALWITSRRSPVGHVPRAPFCSAPHAHPHAPRTRSPHGHVPPPSRVRACRSARRAHPAPRHLTPSTLWPAPPKKQHDRTLRPRRGCTRRV